ncbi:MAG: dipeptide epimerase [Acidobacteria bacterium]|nr:MAG: dipeptide epimerase [Acidobacteriota bacterium]
MKISSLAARFEEIELSRPYTIAFRSVDRVRIGIVELRSEGGQVGLGAASPEPQVTGETEESCREALAEQRLGWLLGRDVRHLPTLCRELGEQMVSAPAARAAVDMALHDLLARELEVPLVEMLGRAHEALPTSITIGIMSTNEALEEAEEYLGRGFRVLKVKLGHSLEEDVERLARLREAVGTEVALRVDPNQGYSTQDLKRFALDTEGLDIEFVEQPLPAGEEQAMRDLPPELRSRLAADESLLNETDALRLLAPPPACGIFNIKLMKCGGLMPAQRIATLAESGTQLMWGCMDESLISISAALHMALASPATRYLDLDGSLDLARDPAEGGFVLEDGLMRTTDEPGIGARLVTP